MMYRKSSIFLIVLIGLLGLLFRPNSVFAAPYQDILQQGSMGGGIWLILILGVQFIVTSLFVLNNRNKDDE